MPQTETTVRAVSPANSNSVSESLPSRKSSKQEDDTDDEPSDQGVESMCSSPSVRLLVRRFSRKEGQVQRRNTFRSTNSIYDECNGKGVIPRTFASPGGHEVPFVLTTWTSRDGRRDSYSSVVSFEFASDVDPACVSSVSTTACSPFYSPILDRCQSSADEHYSFFSSKSMSYDSSPVTDVTSSPSNDYDEVRMVRVTSFVVKERTSSSSRHRVTSSNSYHSNYSSLPL